MRNAQIDVTARSWFKSRGMDLPLHSAVRAESMHTYTVIIARQIQSEWILPWVLGATIRATEPVDQDHGLTLITPNCELVALPSERSPSRLLSTTHLEGVLVCAHSGHKHSITSSEHGKVLSIRIRKTLFRRHEVRSDYWRIKSRQQQIHHTLRIHTLSTVYN